MNSKTWLFLPLVVIGATWGLTIPAIKIAVSVGYPVLGVLFWQVFLAAFVALILFLPKRRALRLTKKRLILFGWIMAFGTILPGIITYTAAFHLPAGVMAITIAMVPIFIMPIAILIGHETFQKTRALGVLMGASGSSSEIQLFISSTTMNSTSGLPVGFAKSFVSTKESFATAIRSNKQGKCAPMIMSQGVLSFSIACLRCRIGKEPNRHRVFPYFSFIRLDPA